MLSENFIALQKISSRFYEKNGLLRTHELEVKKMF